MDALARAALKCASGVAGLIRISDVCMSLLTIFRRLGAVLCGEASASLHAIRRPSRLCLLSGNGRGVASIKIVP